MLLCGDIGGTNARLALFEMDGKTLVRGDALPSRSFPSLEAAVKQFLGATPPKIAAAAFGIAGPVIRNRCEATNLAWIIDAAVLAEHLAIPKVALINDLVALGLGALTLPDEKLVSIQNGVPKREGENLCILAAGTGLGEAGLIWNGVAFAALGSEGGHCDFAPRNPLEDRLLAFLQRAVGGRVSYERVLSGPGIGHLYDFFVAEGTSGAETPANVEKLAAAKDRNAAISGLALSGGSSIATLAIDLFLDLYGAEAGNLALKMLGTGGVFVAGGIAAALAGRFPASRFHASFCDKGRLSPLLAKVPVALVTDTKIGLFGSAAFAKSLA